MAKKFNDLRAKMRPKAREKAHKAAAKYKAEMALDELREARHMTQEHLASLLGIKQPAIAKIERRTDMYLSTLKSIIKAMGGRLVIRAVFAEGDVEISQLRALRPPPSVDKDSSEAKERRQKERREGRARVAV